MDKLFCVVQLVLTVVLLLCVIIGGIGNIAAGNIKGAAGIGVVVLFAAGAWRLVALTWREYKACR